ncbi:MAG: hypothetical protein IPF92_07605 [Myxococcales bacterium]|nr:hypothetical protein [Myxococcales bacterium]
MSAAPRRSGSPRSSRPTTSAPLAHAGSAPAWPRELLGKVRPEALVARLVSRLLAATAAEPPARPTRAR